MTNPRKFDTPAGPATELQWPAGGGQHFRELRGNGLDQSSHHVTVKPLLLDSGEVRFYREDMLEEL